MSHCFKIKDLSGLSWVPGRELLNPWNFSSDGSTFVVSGGPLRPRLSLYSWGDSQWASGWSQNGAGLASTAAHGIRRSGPWATWYQPDLQEGEGCWRLSSLMQPKMQPTKPSDETPTETTHRGSSEILNISSLGGWCALHPRREDTEALHLQCS